MYLFCVQGSAPSFVLVLACVKTYMFRHVSRSAVHSLSTIFNKIKVLYRVRSLLGRVTRAKESSDLHSS